MKAKAMIRYLIPRRRSSLTAFTSARNQTALGREGEPLEGEKSGRADSLSGTQQQQGSWKATKQKGGVEEPGEGKTILHAERVHGGGEISAAPSQILFNSFLDIQLT